MTRPEPAPELRSTPAPVHRFGPGRRPLCSIVAAAAAAVLAAAGARGQTATLTRVLAAGDLLDDGSSFNGASNASIGPGGHVVVFGGVTNIGLAAIVAGLPGSTFKVIARASTPAPGAGGATFASMLDNWVDASGRVLVFAGLGGGGVTAANDRGLYLHNGASLTAVIREGDAAPGLAAGILIDSLGAVAFSNGRVGYTATLTGPGVTAANGEALWVFNAATGIHTLVARTGTAAPIAGLQYTDLRGVLINSAGTLAFVAAVNSGDSSTDTVLLTGTTAANLAVVAREGSQAVGVPAGTVYHSDLGAFGTGRGGFSLNDSGEVLFYSQLIAGGSAGDTGLWRRTGGAGGTVSVVVFSSNAAPGLGSPAPTVGNPQFATLGGTGISVWDSTVQGTGFTLTSDRVVFRRVGVGTGSVVREGGAVPGEPAQTIFGPGGGAYLFDTCVNGTGQLLISAGVSGPGITVGAALGAYGSDPAVNGGAAFKLFHVGDLVGIAGVPGTSFGTLSTFTIDSEGGTQYGFPASVNDPGTAVVRAGVGGGGGAGVYTFPLAPGTFALGACCSGATCSVVAAASCTGAGKLFVGTAVPCNSANSTITPCCFADFNQAGGVSVQDVFDFLAAFFAGDARADINRIGGLTVQDVFDYLAAYFTGCA